MGPGGDQLTTGQVLREHGFGEGMAAAHATSTDMTIADRDDRLEELRDRVAGSTREAQCVFAAERIAAVISLRHTIEEHGAGVEEEMPISIKQQVHEWEQDLDMLFDVEEGVPLFERLSEELLELTGAWSNATDPDEPFI